jgi:hypothetical protein
MSVITSSDRGDALDAHPGGMVARRGTAARIQSHIPVDARRNGGNIVRDDKSRQVDDQSDGNSVPGDASGDGAPRLSAGPRRSPESRHRAVPNTATEHRQSAR